jgi:SAM-dependent methyltransferase
MAEKTIQDVKTFWESSPLFTGESDFPAGSKEFFEEHKLVYKNDCFAGHIDPRIFPDNEHKGHVLDLGCGPGFWSIELLKNGSRKVSASDLTENALALTQKRAQIYGVEISTSLQNAEKMTFANETFSHVNCQGVIHHTPDTSACVREIARVLQPGGTAIISVYYRNIFLQLWPLLKYPGKILARFGASLKGRGREEIFTINDVDEIVRLYDGDKNPLGKSYSRNGFIELLAPWFEIEEVFFHFFPARSLPFPIPRWLHSFLDRKAGFLIYAKCKKIRFIRLMST